MTTLMPAPIPGSIRTPIPGRAPRGGVLTLRGYGLRIAVERGHLIVGDGLADERRTARLSRIDRTLRRLVVVGHAGTISFGALRWLHHVGAAFVQIDTDGQLLVAAGPTGPHLPALRRAQALAAGTPAGLSITRGLLTQKLEGQARVAERLPAGLLALPILRACSDRLASASTLERVRVLEAQAAAAYWTAWQAIPVQFVKGDDRRVPSHWRTVGSRSSVLTASPRRAVNPANTILNYLYAILEAEARIAILAMGLDPALGILHADQRNRDSLACDVMEPVRPAVDSCVWSLLADRRFSRREFFEMADGGCRLLPPMTEVLAETAPRWARLLAPVVEGVAEALVTATGQRSDAPFTEEPAPSRSALRSRVALPTPLTEHHRSAGRHRARREQTLDPSPEISTNDVPSAVRAATEAWPACLSAVHVTRKPEPLSRVIFLRTIVPALRTIPAEALASVTGLSVSYCARIRAGCCVPHRRHWARVQEAVQRLGAGD